MKIISLTILLFCFLGAFTQSTTMIENQALRQISDLKSGKLLIPLNPAQRDVAHGAGGMEWAMAKEENRELREAFSKHFSLCEVLFFYTDEMGSVDEVFDSKMSPVQSPFYDQGIFIAHMYDSAFTSKPDYIEYSKKAEKRRARQQRSESRRSQKLLDWQAKQIARVDENIAHNRDRWSHEQFERALALRAYYENYFEPTEFEREMAFFSPNMLDNGCFVVERTAPVLIEQNKKRSYSFNFQFYERDYPEVDIEERFKRLAKSFESNILLTEARILKKLNREAKLRP